MAVTDKALQVRLGYEFKQKALLVEALTHCSLGSKNNERLEFLGDAVLGAVIAEAVYRKFPQAKEGQLTRMRSRLVKGETLAEVASELGLSAHLRLGEGENKTGGARRASIRADVVESILGAIYLDSGFITCKQVILAWFAERLDRVTADVVKDPKTRLQEWLQKQGIALPEYTILSQKGKPHNLDFTVSCKIEALSLDVRCVGKSRREAEQKAASSALEQLDVG